MGSYQSRLGTLSNVTGVLTWTQREDSHVKGGDRDWNYAASSQRTPGLPEALRGKEGSSSKGSEDITGQLTSWFLDFRLQNYAQNKFMLFAAIKICSA